MTGFQNAAFLLPRIHSTSFRTAEIGRIGSRASDLFQVGEGNCHGEGLVQDERETAPRLAKRGAVDGGIVYINSAFPPSPHWITLPVGAKLGPAEVSGKVSVLLTSERRMVYLGEMKNQSGTIYK